jgi:hypothetical protein
MMAKLTAPGQQQIEIMKSLGIRYDDILDKKGNMKSFVDVLRAFQGTSVTAGQVLQIFGLRAGPGFQVLLNQGTGALLKMMDKVGEFSGTTKKLSNIQISGFKGQLWMLVSAFDELSIAIAKSGVLQFATKFIFKITNLLLKLSETNPVILKLAFGIGALVAVVGPALIVIGAISAAVAAISLPVLAVIVAIIALVGWLGALIYWWDEVIEFTSKWGWALSFILGPIGIVIWAVSLLIKYWEKVKKVVMDVFDWISKLFTKIAESKFGSIVGSLFTEMGTRPEGGLAGPYDMTNLISGFSTQKPKAEITVNIPNAPKGTTAFVESEDIDTSVEQGLLYGY